MSRWLVGTLSCLALGTLSCHMPWTASLPDVAAAPAERPAGPATEPEAAEAEPALLPLVAYLETHRTGLTDAEVRDVAAVIVREAHRHGLDPQLVLAVIHIESRGNAFALSPVGAIGLMQIMPETGAELAETLAVPWAGAASLFDPVVNVQLGVAYLRQLADRYDHLPTALAAYNWGPGRIDGKLRRGVAVPTGYSSSVLRAYAPGTGFSASPAALRAGT